MLPFWIVAGPRLPRRTERKRRFGVWKEHYQAEPETSARAIHLPNCTAGVSRSVQEEVFHREVARMKTSVLPGRKWSEALTKRKTDRHKECSLLLLEPDCTDMASLTLVASIKFTAMYWALSSSIHSVIVVTLAALIYSSLWHWWKKISCSTCQILKKMLAQTLFITQPG